MVLVNSMWQVVKLGAALGMVALTGLVGAGVGVGYYVVKANEYEDLAEAKRIWGDAMSDEELKEWVELQKKIKPDLHGAVPKGATIEIDAKTGKAVPRANY